MIAPRTGQVALHTNYFQFAGSGTINAMDDWHHGHIDTGLAALRESGYETSVRRRDLDFFSYLGYGYDATIGHPNLLFYGETPRDLSVRTDETETAEERFEVGQWKLISIRHPREIFSFLSHLETGEAPDLIDPEWGKSIGGFGLSPNNAVLLALSSRLFAAREKAGHIVAPTPT